MQHKIFLVGKSSKHVASLQVIAACYDNPIPGYGTNTVGNLRLWESKPVTEFKLDEFNEGHYIEVGCMGLQSRTTLRQAIMHCCQWAFLLGCSWALARFLFWNCRQLMRIVKLRTSALCCTLTMPQSMARSCASSSSSSLSQLQFRSVCCQLQQSDLAVQTFQNPKEQSRLSNHLPCVIHWQC